MAVLNFFDILALKPNFFDDADIDERLDKEELKMAILERCGTLLPVYTRSEMFKSFSDSFFKRRKNIISKLIDTTEFDYNPIDNYDRTEEVHRVYDEETTSESNTTGKRDNKSINNSNNESTQENKVSPYDSNEYQSKDKTTTNGSINGTIIDSESDETTGNGSGTSDITEDTITRTHGNIGVTTTQKMIESERKVVLFNVYHWIAIEFEQNFFICVS